MKAIPLIKDVATQAGITQPQAKLAVKAVFGHIQEQLTALTARKGITIRGVGRFYVSDISARNSYNVATGKRSRIPASCLVRFRAAHDWRAVVAERYRKRRAK